MSTKIPSNSTDANTYIVTEVKTSAGTITIAPSSSGGATTYRFDPAVWAIPNIVPDNAIVSIEQIIKLLCQVHKIDFTHLTLKEIKEGLKVPMWNNNFTSYDDIEREFLKYREKLFAEKVEKVILDPSTPD